MIGVNKGNKYNLGKKMSAEARARMSESQQNRLKGKIHFNVGFKRTEEVKKKFSEDRKIKGISEEQKEKMAKGRRESKLCKGWVLSESTKDKIRKANIGKKASDKARLKMKMADKKGIVGVINIDTGIKYKTIKLASENANMNYSTFLYYITKPYFKYKRI